MKSFNYCDYIITVVIMLWEWGVNVDEERKKKGRAELQGSALCSDSGVMFSIFG